MWDSSSMHQPPLPTLPPVAADECLLAGDLNRSVAVLFLPAADDPDLVFGNAHPQEGGFGLSGQGVQGDLEHHRQARFVEVLDQLRGHCRLSTAGACDQQHRLMACFEVVENLFDASLLIIPKLHQNNSPCTQVATPLPSPAIEAMRAAKSSWSKASWVLPLSP